MNAAQVMAMVKSIGESMSSLASELASLRNEVRLLREESRQSRMLETRKASTHRTDKKGSDGVPRGDGSPVLGEDSPEDRS